MPCASSGRAARDTEWATDPTTAAASTVLIHIIASMRMRDDAAAFGWIVDAVCSDLRATRRQREQSEHMCGAYQHTVSRRGVPAGGICTIMVHRTEKVALEHSWLHIAGCIVCEAGRSDGNHEQHGSWSCRSRAASSHQEEGSLTYLSFGLVKVGVVLRSPSAAAPLEGCLPASALNGAHEFG